MTNQQEKQRSDMEKMEDILKRDFILNERCSLKIYRENGQWAIGHINLDFVYLGDTINEALTSLYEDLTKPTTNH